MSVVRMESKGLTDLVKGVTELEIRSRHLLADRNALLDASRFALCTLEIVAGESHPAAVRLRDAIETAETRR